jgi:hypothetical protein
VTSVLQPDSRLYAGSMQVDKNVDTIGPIYQRVCPFPPDPLRKSTFSLLSSMYTGASSHVSAVRTNELAAQFTLMPQPEI